MSYYTRYYVGTTRPSGYHSHSSYRRSYDFGSHRPHYSSSLWQYGSSDQVDFGPAWQYKPDTPSGSQAGNGPRGQPKVDLKSSINRAAHRTENYEIDNLIVRRGQEFNISVSLPEFDREKDVVKLIFSLGEKPQESRGTMVRLVPGRKPDTENGGAAITAVNPASKGSVIELSVLFPSDALVVKYQLLVAVVKGGDKGKTFKHKVKEPVYVLFNPWCQADAVFLANEDERKEYVLNETGRIYVGNNRSVSGKPWNFGQFDKVVLDLALDLVTKSKISDQAYGNPTQVSRALSALVNSNDDSGVLHGRWDGKYHGGTPPTAWNGSPAILEEYSSSKRPVRYGQCWVFSGILTTVCRSLGIPARSVTNFDSAHDHDFSMTIDDHVDFTGEPLDHLSDSVWNFHVWNEAWFKRTDLPDGYDGWQAIDATPQEASEGIMQCGPAPVSAIKEGNIFLGYDAKFIFAEVNGDRITWVTDGDDHKATSVRTAAVGNKISTKAVGSNARQDITNTYKYPEGSAEEREAVKRASHHSSRKDRLRDVYNMAMRQDVKFNFTGVLANNGDVRFAVTSENTSDEPRTVSIHMHATAKYYTGIPGERLGDKHFPFRLDKAEKKETEWTMAAPEYFNELDEDATIGIYVLAKVEETGQIFTESDTYWVEKPELELQVLGSRGSVGKSMDVAIKFSNPLGVPLSSGTLRVEGPGIKGSLIVPLRRTVDPGQEVLETVSLTPKLDGKREIMASFHSKQLTNVCGATEVVIDK